MNLNEILLINRMTIKALTSLLHAKDLTKLLTLNSKFAENFRILDVNYGQEAKKDYDLGHIDKAIYVDISRCTEPSKLMVRPLPDFNCYKDYLGSKGVSNRHHLILYDRSPFGFYASTRLWLILKMLGHSNVSVLNGGLNYWMAKGFSLSHDSTVLADLKKEKFEAKIDNETLIRDFDQIVSNEREVILDARPGQMFESGHIPNAMNVPYNELFDRQTGLLKTKEDLITLFKKHNVDLTKPLVSSCMTGMTAVALTFALEQVGVKDVPVYIGSWTEYVQRTQG